MAVFDWHNGDTPSIDRNRIYSTETFPHQQK